MEKKKLTRTESRQRVERAKKQDIEKLIKNLKKLNLKVESMRALKKRLKDTDHIVWQGSAINVPIP